MTRLLPATLLLAALAVAGYLAAVWASFRWLGKPAPHPRDAVFEWPVRV